MREKEERTIEGSIGAGVEIKVSQASQNVEYHRAAWTVSVELITSKKMVRGLIRNLFGTF